MASQDTEGGDRMTPRWSNPRLECDLVMKGGVTSGLVYPRAVLKLAETYRFRSLGGTSAGAIAAAATAAAELGRAKGGFDQLDAMQKQLGTAGFVTNLFQPSGTAGPAFRLVLGFLDPSNARRSLWMRWSCPASVDG